jgi:hypothetical protein
MKISKLPKHSDLSKRSEDEGLAEIDSSNQNIDEDSPGKYRF